MALVFLRVAQDLCGGLLYWILYDPMVQLLGSGLPIHGAKSRHCLGSRGGSMGRSPNRMPAHVLRIWHSLEPMETQIERVQRSLPKFEDLPHRVSF